MPKKLPADEEKLLRFFIKEGAADEKIPVVAKRFRMTVGVVTRKLGLKRVQEELRVRMEPVRLEQQRQQMLADDVAKVTAQLIEDKEKAENALKAATQMPAMSVTGNELIIEQELMRLVRLDPEKHGRIKLASIQTAFVVAGLMEQGTTRRVSPPERNPEAAAAGVYTNLFDRLRLERDAKAATPEPVAEMIPDAEIVEDVFDLTPPPVDASRTKVSTRVLPPVGEVIEVIGMPPVQRQNTSRVITVEVG